MQDSSVLQPTTLYNDPSVNVIIHDKKVVSEKCFYYYTLIIFEKNQNDI